GRGRVRLLRKHPTTFSPACYVPALFLLGLITGPLFVWHSPWFASFYVGMLGLYAATVLATSLALSVRARELRLVAWLPPVFATIHLGAGAGVLRECIAAMCTRRLPT
ncbi:MAG TPA: hypothetical protein VGG61_06105, partial [Gemmataceae bacterium]